MSLSGENIAITGAKLNNIAEYLVLAFLIYSAYFTGYKDFTIFQGIIMLVTIGAIYLYIGVIPFGLILTPVLFEWLWLDIPFWNFSSLAWAVTGIVVTANIVLWIGSFLHMKEQG
jgi:hypothetical protein|tara:strand:- start:98 stop:442 length:345 start_codon:yes stop_codon:yes gene_type:complete